jgi:hypothetical protein
VKSSSPRPPLRPWVLKLSLVIAVAAWLLLVVSSFVAAPAEDYRLAMVVAAVSWPLSYGAMLLMTGVAAELAMRTQEADLYGPAKNFQLRAFGLFVWFCNVATIVLPTAVALVAILGIIGLLPAPR